MSRRDNDYRIPILEAKIEAQIEANKEAVKSQYKSMFGKDQYGGDMIAWRLLHNERIALMLLTNKTDKQMCRLAMVKVEMDRLSAATRAETDYRIATGERE